MQQDICDSCIYVGPIAGHQHPMWLHHLPCSFLFFPINDSQFILPLCALSDGQISPKKQTKQLFVWQILPNDYIQSISLAPGNAKSNVKMQKKKKKNSNEKSWWPLPYIPGTYQIIIQTGQALWSLETILPWPFALAGSSRVNIFHLSPPTLRSAQRGGGQYLIACNSLLRLIEPNYPWMQVMAPHNTWPSGSESKATGRKI